MKLSAPKSHHAEFGKVNKKKICFLRCPKFSHTLKIHHVRLQTKSQKHSTLISKSKIYFVNL